MSDVPTSHLLSARLASIANAGFIPTSQAVQQRLPHLFSLPTRGRFTILDLSCGKGDFLAPFDGPRADLYGVEISGIRAYEARQRFPLALIVHAPYEETAVSRGRVCVGLANFMYAYQDGERTEHLGILTLTPMLCTDGVLFALLPARSAWKPLLINHLVKFYHDIRLFRVPGEEYARYTQVLVAAVKRARPLKTIDEALPEKLRLEQWIYQEPDKPEQSPWRGGTPPPELPTAPSDALYVIPTASQPVQIRVMRPDDGLLLQYLARSGVHTTPAWQRATTWSPSVQLDQPLVPIEGEAHIAACAMLDMFACEEFRSPDGNKRYTFLAHLDKEWVEVEPDLEERRDGVVRIMQEQDKLQLSVLNISDGHLSHYQNEAVYAFLAPWLPLMKRIINERYPALYKGRPERWLVEATARVGLDGTLRGSSSPGLVRVQLEKMWAMWDALCTKGYVGLAGEQGVGKTRMTIALIAAYAYAWHHTKDLFGKKPPRWITKLEAAWAANPLVAGERPKALPALIECPLNVVESVWMKEIHAAWPEAAIVTINDHTDIHIWFELCAKSAAPAVIAIFPQSKTRATRLRWLPAVIRRKRAVQQFDLSEEARRAGGIPILSDRGNLECYLDPESGEPIMTAAWVERFYCPQCGRLILGHPMKSQKKDQTAALTEESDEADTQEEEPMVVPQSARTRVDLERLEPVGSITYFEYKPRWCSCGSPLWSVTRTAAVERKFPRLPYAQWRRAMDAFMTTMLHENACDEGGCNSSAASGPDLASWKNREGLSCIRLAELPETVTGPVCIQIPDLAIDRSAPIIEEGIPIGYRLPTSDEVIPLYDIRTKQLFGYVSQTTDKVLMKRYGFVAPPADSFSPYTYLEQFFAGLVAFAQIDEGHNARNRDTDIGASTQEAQRAAQTFAYGTGTPYGGVLRSFYYEQARLHFGFWQRLGFGWRDSGRAQKRYGFSRVLTYEREIEDKAHRGTGRTVTTEATRSTPGLAVSLIPYLFSEWIDFSLDEMGAHLPDRVEIPILLPMKEPMLEERRNIMHARWQQADFQVQQAKAHYDELARAMPPAPAEALNAAQNA
jgi:SAM-dependent methyltransferase